MWDSAGTLGCGTVREILGCGTVREIVTGFVVVVVVVVFVRTVQFGMKLYNDQRNAQVFNLLIYLLLACMFRANRKQETWKEEVNK
jgi:hypothetical protein